MVGAVAVGAAAGAVVGHFAGHKLTAAIQQQVGAALDYEDRAPYAFMGTVRNVVFDLAPRTHDDELDLHESTAQAALAHGAAG